MMGPFDASAWVAKSARRATRRAARTGRSLLNMADDETGEEGEWSEVKVGRNVEGVTDPVPPASCLMWQFCLSQVHLHLDASRRFNDFATKNLGPVIFVIAVTINRPACRTHATPVARSIKRDKPQEF